MSMPRDDLADNIFTGFFFFLIAINVVTAMVHCLS